MRKLLLALCLLMPLPHAAFAQAQADVTVESPRVTATIGEMRNSAAYLTLTNKGAQKIVLKSARSTMASKVELHSSVMDADVIRMRQITQIEIAPSESLQLRPGAQHIMLFGLKQALKPGDKVPLVLEFEGGRTLDVNAVVQAESPQEKTGGHEHHHMGGEED